MKKSNKQALSWLAMWLALKFLVVLGMHESRADEISNELQKLRVMACTTYQDDGAKKIDWTCVEKLRTGR